MLLEKQFSRRFDEVGFSLFHPSQHSRCPQIVLQDDHLPMFVQSTSERDAVLGVVWLSASEQADLTQYVDGCFVAVSESDALYRGPLPLNLPWSQSFYLCCQDVSDACVFIVYMLIAKQIRNFIQKFYQFVEGVSQHHRNIDELLSKVCSTTFYCCHFL